MSHEAPGILSHTSVKGYFKEQLDELCAVRKVRLTEPASFYVVNVLSDFTEAERLFLPSDDARKRELVPLAELKARAVEADPDERARLLKHLGDSSLYIGGFFQDALERQNVDVDYYVTMGGSAYTELSSLMIRWSDARGPIYDELGRKFETLVELLSEMADQNPGMSDSSKAVLKLYEKWLKTGSAKVGARLRKRGVIPPGGAEQ
ncbi:MAG: hypothetical protein AB2A00_33435 [Myxococcota bacterium]